MFDRTAQIDKSVNSMLVDAQPGPWTAGRQPGVLATPGFAATTLVYAATLAAMNVNFAQMFGGHAALNTDDSATPVDALPEDASIDQLLDALATM
jgi:hypothetical protein